MATKEEISAKLTGMGFSETDSEALADCMTTKESLSWVNTDPVTQDMIEKLVQFMKENEDLQVKVSVEEVPNRGKYVWDVKGSK